MPFTFSHPAIILPLIKLGQKRISATALVAGSMAPDFEYFIHMEMRQVHGHTISGMVYFDLPLTLALCFLFHYFVRDALIRNSPHLIQQKFESYLGFDWNLRFKNSFWVILYSALIGIASHLFWDSFTHANRFFVNLIPFLQEESVVFGKLMAHHEIAQLGFSILGLGIIALVLLINTDSKWNKEVLLNKMKYWLVVGFVLGIILLLRMGNSLGDYIATGISGTLIGLMIAPYILKLTKRIKLSRQN